MTMVVVSATIKITLYGYMAVIIFSPYNFPIEYNVLAMVAKTPQTSITPSNKRGLFINRLMR